MKRTRTLEPRLGLAILSAAFVCLLVTLSLTPTASAQSSPPPEEQDAQDGEIDRTAFGGPDATPNRIASDSQLGEPLIKTDLSDSYWKWKAQFLEEYGVSFGTEYNSTILTASDSLAGEDDVAAGGIFRFYGEWEALDRGGESPGSLIFLIENTHSYTDRDVSAFAIANEGYAGVSNLPYNDERFRLNTLYWDQKFKGGDLEFIAGFVDISDYVDVYPLVSPWTDFFNLAFSIGGGALDIANDGAVGFAGGAWITDSIYTIAGIADLNSNPEQPWRGFKTFVDDHDYFTHFEIGWTGSSKEAYYLDNIHLTLWHTDDRDGIEDGFGGVLSFTRPIGESWLVYVRAGFANDGGSPLDKSVSIGGGYTLGGLANLAVGSQLGFGANWGQPNGAVFGSGLDDQYTFEAYYRLQVTRELAITPSVQLLVEPALNPEQDVIGLFGLRARLAF